MAEEEGELQEFVAEAGRRLNRPEEEVEPYIQILRDNWFDSPAALVDTRPEELASLGIPLRFAKELISAALAQGTRGGGRGEEAKGRKNGKGGATRRAGGDWREWRREGPGDLKESIGLRECDPAFNLRGALIGEGGRNMHRIQDESGCSVWVVGEDGHHMTLEISAQRSRDLSCGMQMCRDLIAQTYAVYERWHGGGQAPGRSGHGKDGAKGKSKGASKGGGKYHRVIEMEEFDPAFHLRMKFIGISGDNVHYIQDKTGAKVWLLGEQGEAMRLEISADTSEALEHATQMTEDLISSVSQEYDQWLQDGGKDGESGKDGEGGRRRDATGKGGGKDAEMKFSESIDLWDCDSAFNMKGKLIGKRGRGIFHIQDHTGTKLWLFGGDNGEPFRLEVSAHSEEDLSAAVEMAQDIIATLYEEYERWLKDHAGGDGGGKRGKSWGKGKGREKGADSWRGKGHGKGEFSKSLELRACDPAFRVKGALIGDRGRNMQHIKEHTGARIWIRGEEYETLYVDITADSADKLSSAVQMTEDLIDAVYNEYEQWQQGPPDDNGEPPLKRTRAS